MPPTGSMVARTSSAATARTILGDEVAGDAGKDRAQLGRDLMFGSQGNDYLVGDAVVEVEGIGGGDDRLFGEGDDRHNCEYGRDIAVGGTGTDGATATCEVQLEIP